MQTEDQKDCNKGYVKGKTTIEYRSCILKICRKKTHMKFSTMSFGCHIDTMVDTSRKEYEMRPHDWFHLSI